MAVSVVIYTHSSSDNLHRTIKSLSGFDEIILYDLDDNNRSLIKEFENSDKVRIVNSSETIADDNELARNYAILAARSSWVLVIDDDEIVGDDYYDKLQEFISIHPEASGIYIPRKNHILNIWKKSSYPDYQLRLFKKDDADWPREPYVEPRINGKVVKIPAARLDLAIIHIAPFINVLVDRINRHTNHELSAAKPKKVALPTIILNPMGKFLNTYIAKGAFRYGVAGFVSAVNDALFNYILLAKHHERNIMKRECEKHNWK